MRAEARWVMTDGAREDGTMGTPLGDALFAERQARGQTTREMAAELGRLAGIDLAPSTVNRWELGTVEASARYYEALARYLGLNEQDMALLTFRSEMVRRGVKLDEARRWRRRMGRKPVE